MSEVVVTKGGASIGNLQPGWSVQEYATPNAPGDTAGGTGNLNYGIGGNEDSVLLMESNVSFTHPNLGTLPGVVRSSGLTGIRSPLTQDTYLSKFDAERYVPPCPVFDPIQEILLMMRQLGLYSYPNYLPGNATTGYAIPFIGSTFDPTGTVGLETLMPPLVSYPNPYTLEAIAGKNYGVQIVNTANDLVLPLQSTGTNIYPEFAASSEQIPVIQMMLKVDSGEAFRFDLGLGSAPSAPSYTNVITFRVDGTLKNVVCGIPGGEFTVSWSTLNTSQPLFFTLEIYPQVLFLPGATGYTQYQPRVTVRDSTGASVTGSAPSGDWAESLGGGTGLQPYYYSVAGSPELSLLRIYTISVLSSVVTTYPNLNLTLPFDVTQYTPVSGSGAFPSVTGNVWENLQALCAAVGIEVVPKGNTFAVRNVGVNTIDLDNILPDSSLSVGRGNAGRSVEIEYNNARFISGLIYSAYDENASVLSVGPNEVSEQTIITQNFPIQLVQPQKITWTPTTSLSLPGAYTIIDSTGLQIVDQQWFDYGGSLRVSLAEDVTNGIVVTLTGPTIQIPSTTAPYSVAVSDGATQYPFLNITGSGVSGNIQTLSLLTGAVEDVITRDVAFSVKNPFITSLSRAYDRGIWASSAASGTAVTITGSFPTNLLSGFGIAPGALVRYRDGIYRVTDANVTRMETSFTAIRHTTVGRFDSAWAGTTVGTHDAAWSGYQARAEYIYPLRFR